MGSIDVRNLIMCATEIVNCKNRDQRYVPKYGYSPTEAWFPPTMRLVELAALASGTDAQRKKIANIDPGKPIR